MWPCSGRTQANQGVTRALAHLGGWGEPFLVLDGLGYIWTKIPQAGEPFKQQKCVTAHRPGGWEVQAQGSRAGLLQNSSEDRAGVPQLPGHRSVFCLRSTNRAKNGSISVFFTQVCVKYTRTTKLPIKKASMTIPSKLGKLCYVEGTLNFDNPAIAKENSVNIGILVQT